MQDGEKKKNMLLREAIVEEIWKRWKNKEKEMKLMKSLTRCFTSTRKVYEGNKKVTKTYSQALWQMSRTQNTREKNCKRWKKFDEDCLSSHGIRKENERNKDRQIESEEFFFLACVGSQPLQNRKRRKCDEQITSNGKCWKEFKKD